MSSVASHVKGYHLLLLCLPLLLFHLGTPAINAADTLVSGRNITDGDTLVSAGGSFTMGFFSLGVPARRYLGIWFTVSEDAVCWVANRDRPINGSTGSLLLGDGGSLLLLDGGGRIAWTSNSTGASSSSVTHLLDSSNLVVRDVASSSQDGLVLWQSFDHPSNTLLPGMKTGKNLWTGAKWYITSWRSPTDPSPGPYRRGTQTAGLPENAVWRGGVKTYRTGPWNGLYFNGVPEMVSYANFFTYQVTVSPGEVTYAYHAKAGAPLSRIIITDTGILQRLAWDRSSRAWKTFYSAPRDACDAYARCGAFGLCDAGAASTSFCSCVKGFTPVSPLSWYMRETSGGCRRSVGLDCTAGDRTSASTTDGFAVVRGVKLPDTHNVTVDGGIGLEECRERCLANCSCVAYAASDIRAGSAGHGCIIWSGDIVDIRYMEKGHDLYLRLAKSELTEDARGRRMSVAMIATICTVCAAATVFLCLALIILRNIRRKISRDARTGRTNKDAVLAEAAKPRSGTMSVASVDLATIVKATRNFSTRNAIGEGGFGVVYEGQLPNDQTMVEGLPAGRTKVAVKRLKLSSSSLPNRVLSHYTREVEMVCNLRHKNLVRLLAYCPDGDERILVYECVQNKSLNLYIFGKPSTRASLSWAKRLEIIRGIAQGVWYLHEGSGEQLVHRDLKPSNVLLDQQGYASPELAKDGEMTPKCDVFSFGVVLLEIISGLRNSAAPSVISQAWKMWEEHRVMDLLDPAVAAPARRCSGSHDDISSELRRCIQIGLNCVQQSPGDRPAMSAVLAMLGSKDSLLQQPKDPARQLGHTCYRGMSLDSEQSTVVNLT